MPTITYDGETYECADGDRLRDVLLENGASPHTGIANQLNCNGHATCGTCAVRISDGPTGEATGIERTRLSVARHDDPASVRLACQYEVETDVTIEQP
jgi:Na+-transporting NADH:ubiquinone oxidoreductase, subunit NqrF